MFCPSCGTGVQLGQKFCNECGFALAGAGDASASVAGQPVAGTSPTAPSGVLPPPNLAPPAAAPPAAVPLVAVPAPAAFEATAALNVVEQTSATGYTADPWDTAVTGQWPQGGDTGQLAATQVAAGRAFRFTPLLGVAVVAGVVAVAAAFVEIASYSVAGDFVDAQSFKINDFSSNFTVGALIGAILLVGGAWLGATGRRLGAGLAGGAGLALAGMFGYLVGQVIALFDAQEVSLISGGGTFTLTTTQEVGFWLAVVAAALGVLAFILSLSSAGSDGLPPVNPAIGVAGALGTLAVAVGPLIPMNGGSLGDNFSNENLPPAYLYLRLAVLVLIGVGGLVGFLTNRRWGFGTALGAISIGAWQWVTSITESGDLPIGIAGGNPFPDVADPFAPHLVTSIGVIVMLLAGVGGLLLAVQQRDAH